MIIGPHFSGQVYTNLAFGAVQAVLIRVLTSFLVDCNRTACSIAL